MGALDAKLDEKLQAKLSGHDALPILDAYVQLRPNHDARSADQREAAVQELLKRIEKLTNVTPRYNYLDLLDSVHVSAAPEFLRRLIAQPEVIHAGMAPDLGDSAMIAPENPRKVPRERIDTPVRRK